MDSRRIAQVALDNGVLLYELTPQLSSLEDAYFDLTKDEVEYHSHLTGGPAVSAPATAGK
jgi:ABC-2 type transport system ATP-binding protein